MGAAVRRTRKERGDRLRRKLPTPGEIASSLRQRSANRRAAALLALNESAAARKENGGRALRGYEGFANV